MYAVLAVTAVWACAAIADRITFSHVLCASFANPVGKACTFSSGLVVGSVWHTDITITGLITVAGGTSVEAFTSICATIIT